MRLYQIKYLLRLYNAFFVRKVLNFGILKNPFIRLLLLAVFIILFTLITFLIFTFFSDTLQKKETILFLLNTYSNTIILWTIVVTIFLKVIFSKVDGFLRMTLNFPISSKERNFSIFLYETLISFTVIFLLSFSVVFSMILIHKFAYADTLMVNIIYVSTFTYLVLQVISKLTSYVCCLLRIPKLFHIINLSILVFIFAMFFREAQKLVMNLASDLINGTNKAQSILLLFQHVHQEYGFLLTTLMYLVSVAVLLGIIITIPDQSYMSNSKHVLIAKTQSMRLMKAYVLSSLRNVNTINTVAFVYLATIILLIFGLKDFILYSTIILAINGIYSFVYSQNLRQMMYKFHYVAWKDYFYLVVSQLIIVYLVSIPIFVAAIFIVDSYINLLFPYLIVTLSVLLFVLAGILFPPYHDNPFSVVTSITVVTVPILVIGISLAFLSLGMLLNIMFIIFFYLFIILFSIQGLINLQRSFRNEKDVYGH